MSLIYFFAGFALCYVTFVFPNYFRKAHKHEQEQTTMIKRTKPSYRNPMRTYNTSYDEFKTKRGLYEPVKHKADNKNDIEVGR